VTMGDSAAVDIYDVFGKTEFARYGERNRGEGFVDLDAVQAGQLPVCTFQRLMNGGHSRSGSSSQAYADENDRRRQYFMATFFLRIVQEFRLGSIATGALEFGPEKGSLSDYAEGNGIVKAERPLSTRPSARPGIGPHFEIRFLDPGVKAYAFTFG